RGLPLHQLSLYSRREDDSCGRTPPCWRSNTPLPVTLPDHGVGVNRGRRSTPVLAAAPAVARPSHRLTAALGDLRAVVGGEGVQGAVVVPAAGGPAYADESGQDGVVGGLGLAGLPGEHSLAHGVQAGVDVTRVNVVGEGATVLVVPEPLGASVGPARPDVGPAFGAGAVEEDERGCGVGRKVHRRSEKPGGPPGRAAAGGPPWQRALLVAAENRSCPWETTHWRMADSGRRCCVLYTTQPLASSPRRQDGLDDDDLEGSDH